MVHRNRLRPTYASVTATLALFIALGGGAYAATALPANSVGPKQIKKNAVERSKLKSNAVDTTKILDNSVTGDDVKESFLDKVPSAALADSATHADSAAALDRASYRTVAGVVPEGSGAGATAGCDPGQRVIGGGVRVDDPTNAWIVDGFPNGGTTQWTARVANSGTVAVGFTVYAICTSVAAVG